MIPSFIPLHRSRSRFFVFGRQHDFVNPSSIYVYHGVQNPAGVTIYYLFSLFCLLLILCDSTVSGRSWCIKLDLIVVHYNIIVITVEVYVYEI